MEWSSSMLKGNLKILTKMYHLNVKTYNILKHGSTILIKLLLVVIFLDIQSILLSFDDTH